MSFLILIVIILVAVILPIYLSIRFLKTGGSKNNQDDIISPKFKTKDPWQKRNIFNGILYFVGLPAIWLVLVVISLLIIVNGF